MKLFVVLFLFPFLPVAAQTDDSWRLYSDSTMARIDITIDAAKLQWIYNNVQSDSEHVASMRFRNWSIDETVDTVGFRLRGNTSRTAKKKSFKLSFNSFVKGKNFHGVEKLNLNGEHNDPSIIRSKLSFDLFRDMGIIASRANHVRVYINGKYYGLYVSVEHVDEEFLKKNFADDSGNLWKCLYPADLKYLGADPNLYKNIMNGSTPAYELGTNEDVGDFSKLARLIDIINNTPSNTFADSIETILDVYGVLQYFAVNTLVGSWDDYRSLMNNYYLYHDPSKGKFTLIPYDYDNTFGVDWFNTNWAAADPYNYPKAVAGARPLWEKLMANNEYRNLYTHFLSFYRAHVYSLPVWESRLNRIKDTITTAAIEDTYRTLDYGFSVNDFQNSYSAGAFSKLHVKFGLREFVNTRNSSLLNQLRFVDAAPVVYRMDVKPVHPRPSDSITVSASCFGAAGLKKVSIQFTPNGSSTVTVIAMSPAPFVAAKRADEFDRWTGVIPPLNMVRSGSFRIFILDSLDRAQLYPAKDSITITTSSPSAQSVVINEFMADNTTFADPSGQFDDWVELYNPTSQPVILTNKFLTDKSTSLAKWKFKQANLAIGSNQYLIVWCDEDTTQPGIHAGFKLSAGGEYIALTDSNGVSVLDSISFGAQKANVSFGRYPNGSSMWGSMNPTPLAANSMITLTEQTHSLPDRFDVDVFPNPFNPATTIQYRLPTVSDVAVDIVDIMGRSVWSYTAGGSQAGTHILQWTGKLRSGLSVSSGIYLLRLKANNAVLTKKLLLLK